MSKSSFDIQALTLGDVPAAARLSADAFETDRQTEMKGSGKEPYDLNKHWLESLPSLLRNPRIVILKVVDEASGDEASGDVMGYCIWGFRGFQPEEMPVVEGRSHPPADASPAKPKDKQESSADPEPKPEPEPETDPIKRLEARTSADMQAWMAEAMPEGTRCIFVVGLSVSPKYQGRGVGSALLRWGTRFCDDNGVFAWVQSSEPAWRMYGKSGFQVIRALDMDLDEYAPMPPPNEGPGAKWGHYVFRYMKYLPKKR
ncbi:GCN5-related N-acetyltransferase (GNAT) domain protein [Tolypocladium capitatum]|uniref:GCN5-related N-acetyltransferase (GNAT) domain protein n=1 Tax=Tolypocladium capitatum TaxID=45235 RepID=A0A2K3QCF8_9HYPO|nr:GCN5-related N-acetyltransferase (GNAT) domain protein [Tolypocladium capitatum]